MLPKLSERAAMRATAHIRRYYPDWRQGRILDSGSESDQLRMDEFISSCKDHLAKLRNQIAEGETPCIDTKWPEPIDNRVELGTNDEGLIIVEKIVPDPALTEALEQTKRKLDEALASRGEPEPQPEMPPEGIADLFQADRPYAEQAKALWDRYNELTQKIMLKVATDAEREKHTKLQGELDWIKRHAFEGI